MNPIYRSVYRAQAQSGQAENATAHFKRQVAGLTLGLSPGDLLTISLFRWGAQFLCYWESIERAIPPNVMFGDTSALLIDWPGGAAPRQCVPMADIYHYLAPQSLEDWRRKQPIDRISGKLARLKPDMISSYIFYHYQFQEEQPGSFAKYGIISLHEDLIFFYQEMPYIVEEPRRTGKLRTANTPDHWQEVMFPHFALWEDVLSGQEIWRDIELIAHRGIDP